MKSSRFLLVVLASVLVITCVSVAQAQEDVEDPEETLQVVLVLDVSKSMHEPVLYGDLPEELLAVIDQLNAIEEDAELAEIEAQIDAIWNDPEIVEARRSWQVSVEAVDAWFAENEYAQSQEAIIAEINAKLSSLGCDAQFDQALATALTLEEVDYWIEQACGDAGIQLEDEQALREMVPYLGDPDYTDLQQESNDLYKVFYDALEERNYNELIARRKQFIAEVDYDGLKAELDDLIAKYEIPRKLDLAKLAAKTLIGLSRLDEVAGRRTSLNALVRFSSDYLLLQELTPNLDAVEQKIEGLEPLEQTNIYGGLDQALEELERGADPEQPTVIILLSDGHITIGRSAEEVLADIPPRAEELNANICTVGFGASEAHVDKELLEGLAEETDGEYIFARSGAELVNFFLACRQSMVGEIEQRAGMVQPGESTDAGTLVVPVNICEMSLALNYVRGGPTLSLVDPIDTQVEEGAYDQFGVQAQDNLTLYTVLNPIPGEWKLSVQGDPTLEEEAVYSIVITTNECKATPTPSGPPTPTPTVTPVPFSSYVEQAVPVLPLAILVVVVLGFFLWLTLRAGRASQVAD
jgi:hypothetical protein